MDDIIVRDLIKQSVETAADIYKSISNLSFNSPVIGFVVRTYEDSKNPNLFYGHGSVEVVIPKNSYILTSFVIATPLVAGHGNFEIPIVGSTVLVFSIGDTQNNITRYYYMNASPIDSNPFNDFKDFAQYFNTQKLGFAHSTVNNFKGYVGGRFVKKVLDNPGQCKIVASTEKFIIYESDKDKELQIRAEDDFHMKLQVGDEGKIFIGYSHPKNDTSQTGNADVLIDVGIEGSVEVDTVDGHVEVRTTTGYIFLQSGDCSIDITPNGIFIKGDVFIDGETMISKNIHWNTVGFTPTGTPPYNTATRNIGKTHTHPSPTGPTGPPIPGT